MCTNFALIKSNGVAILADQLKVDPEALRHGSFKAASKISIVVDAGGSAEVLDAIWWLYLHQTPEGLKPHPDYFSVNTNHAKLPKKPEYRKARCIVLASSFFESQDGKKPHELRPADGSAIAFGGLYKHWVDKTTGEVVHSASIITLAGHPALANIHRTSVPLWLPNDEFDAWLSRDNTDTQIFELLLTPQLRTDLIATPIDKVSTKNPVGDSAIIRCGAM